MDKDQLFECFSQWAFHELPNALFADALDESNCPFAASLVRKLDNDFESWEDMCAEEQAAYHEVVSAVRRKFNKRKQPFQLVERIPGHCQHQMFRGLCPECSDLA